MASISTDRSRSNPYRVFWTDKNSGKTRNKSFGRRKDATAFLQTLGSDKNIVAQSDPNITVSDALNRWYTLCTTTGRGGREPIEHCTAIKYDSHRTIIIGLIGAKKLINLDRKACEDFRDLLLEHYSRPYAKKILVSFKSSIIQAVTDNLIPSNPAADTHIIISKRQKNANRVQIPSLAEIKQLTSTIDNLMCSPNGQMKKAWARYGAMFYTQMYSGMRPTEVRGLPWKDVDWERGGIEITQDADDRCKIGILKTGASYRFIPLPTFIMDMLREWKKLCPIGKLDLVFPTWKGTVESHSNITNRGWYVLCDKAGHTETTEDGRQRAKFTLNSLRHIKASLEIALGRSPKRIQQVMGHEDIKLTFDTYGHLFEDESMQDDPNDLMNLIASAM